MSCGLRLRGRIRGRLRFVSFLLYHRGPRRLTIVASNDSGKLRITGGAELEQQASAQILSTVMDLQNALTAPA